MEQDRYSPEIEVRRRWMAVLAKAEPQALERAMRALLPEPPPYTLLRRPETGLVMVRGRAGGDGRRFNLGEMTLTRCSVRLDGGAVGHSYIAGRDRRHAELAALADALLQQDAIDPEALITPLAAAQQRRREEASAKSAETRVDFFTLVRGED